MDVALRGPLDVSAGEVRDKIEALLEEIWRGGMGAGSDDDSTFATTEDLVQDSGLSPNTVRKRIKELMRDGRIEKRRVWRVSIMSDNRYPCYGYRLKPPDTEPPD